MKIALLTSDHLRHKYLAHALTKKLVLDLIITEKKSSKITATNDYSKKDALFLKEHFSLRHRAEQKYFKKYKEFPTASNIFKVNHGKINSAGVKNLIMEAAPKYIILFGTSIIGNQLLKEFPSRIINFHLGLSPYYKGSATNLFPYYFQEPECIGGTIHIATSRVDQGAILKQFRPDINQNDDLHDIGNKVILQGGKLLPEILLKYDQNKLQPTRQEPGGKVFRNKDFNPEKLRRIYINFKKGMIKEYLLDKERRDREKPIIN